MNAKTSVFVIYVEAIIYVLLYNLHGCTFKGKQFVEYNHPMDLPRILPSGNYWRKVN